jgi:hypothetical protein
MVAFKNAVTMSSSDPNAIVFAYLSTALAAEAGEE